MGWLFAFLHHAAAFALVAALTVELVLIREEPSMRNARRLQRADMAVTPSRLRVIRNIIHWELFGVVLILLCAALMARGIGSAGT